MLGESTFLLLHSHLNMKFIQCNDLDMNQLDHMDPGMQKEFFLLRIEKHNQREESKLCKVYKSLMSHKIRIRIGFQKFLTQSFIPFDSNERNA